MKPRETYRQKRKRACKKPTSESTQTARDLQDIRGPVSGSQHVRIISANWDVLRKHLMATRLGYNTVVQKEDWLFDNRSNRLGDDLKDDV